MNFDYLVRRARNGALAATEILDAVLRGFSSIWPGREVIDGVKTGDSIVAGPYQAVRDMKDSTRVKSARDEKGGRKP